ncbi:MAG: hypothetical protein EAS52_11565 [Parapedobacter sp.]|nr:MAG: hypothetical protein EAS52_11565 [Parapedobacter sp.]
MDNFAALTATVQTKSHPDQLLNSIKELVDKHAYCFANCRLAGDKLRIYTGDYHLFDFRFSFATEIEHLLKQHNAIKIENTALENAQQCIFSNPETAHEEKEEYPFGDYPFLRLVGSDFKKNNAQNKAIRIDCHVHRSHKEDFVEALAAVCPDENIDVFYYFQSASGDDINLMLFFTNGRQYTHRIRNVPLNLFGEKISLLAEKYRVSFGFADGYNLDTGDEPNIRLMVDQDYIITQRPKPPLFKSLLKWINSI